MLMGWCAGLAVRMPLSFLVMYGAGLNWRERLFIAFAWSPKVRFCCSCTAYQALPLHLSAWSARMQGKGLVHTALKLVV